MKIFVKPRPIEYQLIGKIIYDIKGQIVYIASTYEDALNAFKAFKFNYNK